MPSMMIVALAPSGESSLSGVIVRVVWLSDTVSSPAVNGVAESFPSFDSTKLPSLNVQVSLGSPSACHTWDLRISIAPALPACASGASSACCDCCCSAAVPGSACLAMVQRTALLATSTTTAPIAAMSMSLFLRSIRFLLYR